MTEQALAAGVGRPEQYQTVYSGMDVEAFLNPPRPRDEVRRELGLADDEVAFGTVARLFERKGHDDILAVAPRVLAANPDVRFVFIGDGILRDRLIADAERLGVRHAFHFVGLVPPGRIPELLGAIDAVVHPSLREGLARVLPQALLVGRPVISYDVDGAREVVLPETGILLAPRDLTGLAAAILRLAADPALRARDGPGRAAAVRRPVPPRDDDRPAPLTLRATPGHRRPAAVGRLAVAGILACPVAAGRMHVKVSCCDCPLDRLKPVMTLADLDLEVGPGLEPADLVGQDRRDHLAVLAELLVRGRPRPGSSARGGRRRRSCSAPGTSAAPAGPSVARRARPAARRRSATSGTARRRAGARRRATAHDRPGRDQPRTARSVAPSQEPQDGRERPRGQHQRQDEAGPAHRPADDAGRRDQRRRPSRSRCC